MIAAFPSVAWALKRNLWREPHVGAEFSLWKKRLCERPKDVDAGLGFKEKRERQREAKGGTLDDLSRSA